MRRQRWAVFAMGAWIAGSVFVSIVASQNFYTIDRLLSASANQEFRAAVERLGAADTRDLLRYLSSELNRLYFQLWNVAQLLIGGTVLALLAGQTAARRAWWGVIAMVAVVLVMALWLMPHIVAVGRSLDFVPRHSAPPALGRFWILHGLYTSMEVAKLTFGVVVARWIGQPWSDPSSVSHRALKKSADITA
jgi:hypothetical protein